MIQLILDNADRVYLEEVLFDLSANNAPERYRASTKLYDAAAEHRTTVLELLRVFFNNDISSRGSSLHESYPGEDPNSPQAMTDTDLVEKSIEVVRYLRSHSSESRFFTADQLSFLADLPGKLRKWKTFTYEQRQFALDLIEKFQRGKDFKEKQGSE